MQQNTPRIPTIQELEQLTQFMASQNRYHYNPAMNLENAQQLVKCAYIAVFDKYFTDLSNYNGKLMTVIFTERTSKYMVYTWRDDGLQEEEQEEI